MPLSSHRPLPPAHARPLRAPQGVCDVSFPMAFTPGCLVVLSGDLVLAAEVLDHVGAGLHGTATPMWDHVPVLTVRPEDGRAPDQHAHSVHVIQANLQASRAVIAVGEAGPAAAGAHEPLADLTVEVVDGDADNAGTWLLEGSREAGLRATACGPHVALRTLGLMTALSQAGLFGIRTRR